MVLVIAAWAYLASLGSAGLEAGYQAIVNAVSSFGAFIWNIICSIPKLIYDPSTVAAVLGGILRFVFWCLGEGISLMSEDVGNAILAIPDVLASDAVVATGRVVLWLADHFVNAAVLTAAFTMFITRWPILFGFRLLLVVVHYFWGNDS